MASPTQWTWVWVNSGVGDGQGGLVCCSSWGCKELHTTEWLNWTELKCSVNLLQFSLWSFFFPLGHNFKHYTSPLLWFINFLPKDYLLGQTLVKFLWTLLAIHCPWPTKPGFSKEFLLSIYWESPNPLYPINLLFPFIFD